MKKTIASMLSAAALMLSVAGAAEATCAKNYSRGNGCHSTYHGNNNCNLCGNVVACTSHSGPHYDAAGTYWYYCW
jgi:hypothetical protein